MKARKHVAGYTLVEVMMAIGIMTVGAVGIMSLQAAASAANIQAHHMSMATESTRTWLERLRRAALGWEVAGAGGLTNVDYLKDAIPLAADGVTDWTAYEPSTTADSLTTADSWGFDYRGYDTRTTGDIVYCTNVKLAWSLNKTAIRADVRTWWYRYSNGSRSDYDSLGSYTCNKGDASAVDAALTGAGGLRAVYGSELIRPTEIRP